MREIKYREYLGNGRWHYWGFGIESGYGFTSPIQTHDGRKLTSDEYTSLKDKNGVEIYEGDIIQKTNSQTGQKTVKSVVTYNVNSARFTGISFGTSMNMEVIGNIYEVVS